MRRNRTEAVDIVIFLGRFCPSKHTLFSILFFSSEGWYCRAVGGDGFALNNSTRDCVDDAAVAGGGLP
jgi:hypothetical protein